MKKVKYILVLIFFSCGASAQTVTIGKQVWMSKNLNVDKFRNGDPIPQAKTTEEWIIAAEDEQPAWCYYEYEASNETKYGKLYNWYAVKDPRGLAPGGYHIPSDAEWTILANFLGGESVAGRKMKSTSGWASYTSGGKIDCSNCASWSSEYRMKVPCHTCKDTRQITAPIVRHSGNGSNLSGFNGLQGGWCSSKGFFLGGGTLYDVSEGRWWSSSASIYTTTNAFMMMLINKDGGVYVDTDEKSYGYSVRCLRN